MLKAVVGMQFGDEGKGKLVDYLSQDIDHIVRFNGGANAGHTVQVGNIRSHFSQIPAILGNRELYITQGALINPEILLKELQQIENFGFTSKVHIDPRCHVVLPIHVALNNVIDMLNMGKKKIIILDVDGTLTQKQSIWEYLLKEKGKWDKKGAENLRKFIKKEISYQEFCDLDAALLQGEKYDELKKIAYSTPMHRGIGELFGTLKEKKYIICLVSTGLKLLVDYFLERYEIDYFKVNDLEQHNGICTGKSIINIHEQGKGDVVNEIFKRYGEAHLSAMGDSEGDVPVFEKADVSFAINSTSKRLNALAQHTLFSDNLMDTTKYL